MTEDDWLTGTDPTGVFEFVRIRASLRKIRLHLCGGCRHIRGLFFRPESLAAVEVAERFADGKADLEEMETANWAAEVPTFGYDLEPDRFLPGSDIRMETVPRLVEMGVLPETALAGNEWHIDEPTRRRLLAAASLAEACTSYASASKAVAFAGAEEMWFSKYLARVDWPGPWLSACVFGNPFRELPRLDDATLRRDDGTVAGLAAAAYEDRLLPSGCLDPERLAVLADALEDAAADVDLLSHLRGIGPHVRGCWALDLLLGKS